MNPMPGIMAVVPDLSELAKTGAPAQSSLGSLAVILLVGLLVALGFVIWAVLLRKPAGRRERGMLQDAPEESGDDKGSGRRHRRRRRSSHRGRNPTLSETGGLPPQRDEPPRSQT